MTPSTMERFCDVVSQLALSVSVLTANQKIPAKDDAQHQSNSSVNPSSALSKELTPRSLAPEEEPPLYSPDNSPRRYPATPAVCQTSIPYVIPKNNEVNPDFYIGDSGGINFTRLEVSNLEAPTLNVGNVNSELPRFATKDNIRRYGEAQLKEAIASRMDATLLRQWDGVLQMGLSLERSVRAFVGSTEATEIGSFTECLSLRQRENEPPVLFAVRAQEHVRTLMKPGVIRDSMTVFTVLEGLLPGFRSRLPSDPPTDLTELMIALQDIFDSHPYAIKRTTTRTAPPIPRIMEQTGPRFLPERPWREPQVAVDRICYTCNKRGHVQRFCPARSESRPRKSPRLPIPIYYASPRAADFITVEVRIGTKEVDGLIDSGSSLSLCSIPVAALASGRHASRISLQGFTGPPQKSSEVATINFAHEGGRYTWDFVVTPNLNVDLILGLDYLEREASLLNFQTRRVTFNQTNAEPRNRTNSEPIKIAGAPKEVQSLVDNYRDTFALSTAELGRAHEFRCDIPTTGEPFRHTYRSIAYTL